MAAPRQYFPLHQTWKGTLDFNDGLVHLVEYEEGYHIYGQLRLRCGYYVRQGSCVWSTKAHPTCQECILWLRGYWAQVKLPFLNRYNLRTGSEWHDPLEEYPSQEWISTVLSSAP